MQKVAVQILTASVVFYLLMLGIELLVRGAAFSGATLMANLFITLIFAMIYAAFRVGVVIFGGGRK
ncbi:hypothetical protein AB2B41_20140 [Marimonas sp. MJW-29]|uniref:Uncharacterized protein n=1 Tax=Sulfitobacter sediminis TaxID=3234186 RepID=A0ABV3RSF7_9RHOB